MVEREFGIIIADNIVTNSDLPSGGAYTAVGTYSHAEMVQLVTNLSKETNISVNDLLLAYAEHFFSVLASSYPTFIEGVGSAFNFFSSIENHIHVEVLKLYPDAELPRFETILLDENTLEMTYYSERKMAAFARGLLNSAVIHFKEDISITQEDISGDGGVVKFTLIKA
jgi:hypothetical protein